MTTKVMRPREWSQPSPPVRREVLTARVDGPTNAPPVLFVPGYGHGAWAYAEHWLEHTAERGFPAYAVSLRGHGNSASAGSPRLHDYVHDVTQVAAGLPKQAVLVGHGAGALVVAQAMARYPAKAGVLISPIFGRHLRRRGLFSSEVPPDVAKGYVARLDKVPFGARWELLRRREPEAPVGDPPVLVVGSPDDKMVPDKALEAVARRYSGAPLLFPGMGHDLMLDARWAEPIDAILDWLQKL
jgi:pimeloyl-ACP methyl ester carboxylesterase